MKVSGFGRGLFEAGNSLAAGLPIAGARKAFGVLGKTRHPRSADRPARALKGMGGNLPVALSCCRAEGRHGFGKLRQKQREYLLFKRLVAKCIAAQVLNIDRGRRGISGDVGLIEGV